MLSCAKFFPDSKSILFCCHSTVTKYQHAHPILGVICCTCFSLSWLLVIPKGWIALSLSPHCDYILNDSLVCHLMLSVCFLTMQIKGNQLSEVMKSASSEAIDLVSVSSFILSFMVYHSNIALFDYFILFSTSCSHYAHGILARDQRPRKCSSTPSFR